MLDKDLQAIVENIPVEDLERSFGKRVHQHPPHLTRTERIRFTRSFYLFWSLVVLPPNLLQPRLELLSLKQLYYAQEIIFLTRYIGSGEKEFPPAGLPTKMPLPEHTVKYDETCCSLQHRIWAQLQSNFWRIHHCFAEVMSGYLGDDSGAQVLVICDHWQEKLTKIVCHREVDANKPPTELEIQYCLGEGEDEAPGGE